MKRRVAFAVVVIAVSLAGPCDAQAPEPAASAARPVEATVADRAAGGAPKGDAATSDAAKGDAAKADASKAEVTKSDAAKSDAAKVERGADTANGRDADPATACRRSAPRAVDVRRRVGRARTAAARRTTGPPRRRDVRVAMRWDGAMDAARPSTRCRRGSSTSGS